MDRDRQHNAGPSKPREAENESRLRLHPSRAARATLIALGFTSLALGVLGVFLPLLPTTVFVLIAAYCFARSSERFYAALLGSRHFGPAIRRWQTYRCIPQRSKLYAIALILLSFSLTTGLFVTSWYARVALIALGLSLILYLYRLPTCPADV